MTVSNALNAWAMLQVGSAALAFALAGVYYAVRSGKR